MKIYTVKHIITCYIGLTILNDFSEYMHNNIPDEMIDVNFGLECLRRFGSWFTEPSLNAVGHILLSDPNNGELIESIVTKNIEDMCVQEMNDIVDGLRKSSPLADSISVSYDTFMRTVSNYVSGRISISKANLALTGK